MKGKRLFGFLLLPLALFALVAAAFFAFAMMFMGTAQEEQTMPDIVLSDLGESEIPPQYVPIYQAAAAKYKIPWTLLAAIHRVETVFSTSPSMQSYAGAEGHMQFMPCTWTGWGHPSCGGLGRGQIPANEKVNPALIAKYGGFGVDANGDGKADPFDIEDAIYTAANYLARNGAAENDVRKAVFTYNHSEKYVSDVLGFMQKFSVQKPDPVIKLVATSGGFAKPLNTAINSRFGMRLNPVLKIWRLHGGIDFECATGDPIPASRPGVVSHAAFMDPSNPAIGLGLYVWVEHGGGFKSGYAHLSGLNVKVGDQVNAGDIVGVCGSTGNSTGDHLHFEIYKNNVLVDPAPYLGIQ